MKPSDTSLDHRLNRLSTAKQPVVRLVVFATALACILLLGFTTWFIWSARQTQLHQTEVATSNVARMIGAQVEAAMKSTGMALTDISERVRHDGTGVHTLERLQAHLVELAKTSPELHGLFVYDAAGKWLATSLSRPVKGNNADRAYFEYHLRDPGEHIHIGAPLKSRSTGVWIIPVSRRINGPDGAFAGVALVTLRINFFERIYEELDIGPSGTVLLASSDGTVIYRRPFDEKLIGSDLSDGVIFNELRKRPVGSAMLAAKVDGIERLYSYRRLNTYPFVVAVGRSKDDLLSNWKRASILIAAAALLVSAVFAVFARKLVIQIIIRDKLDQTLRGYSERLQEHNLGLQLLADTDKLTKIANRRRFDELLEQELRRAQRTGTPVSLILLDLDHFKRFNDEYGHLAGDHCLQSAAQVLTEQVARAGDFAARYGGEEFAVIMPNTDQAGATAVGERIRAAIAALDIAHRHSPAGVVTASLGVATASPCDGDMVMASEMIAEADKHLYEAKRRGRNQVCA